MYIAFYAPLKPPDHPVPSGDRKMARLLIRALQSGGHTVETVSRFCSFDATGDPRRQQRLGRIGERLAHRLSRRLARRPRGRRPDLWFTYHLYHKAPDWLGPPVSRALGLPYVVAEASHAPKQADGRWALGHDAATRAITVADLVFGLNPGDAACVLPLLQDRQRWVPLPPFIDTVAFAHSSTARRSARRALAEAGGFDAGEPLLLSVAMMRQGDKLASYRLLGTALPRLLADPWRLAVVGDGPARALVETALAPLAGRTLWLGRLAAPALADIYAAADVCVWPAVNEAFGVALIEAQAAGLPVVAGWTPGVAAVVADGETGLLVPAGDTAAFAAAVRRLLGNADIRRRMGEAARQRVADRHSIAGATATLDAALRRLARTGKESRCAGA